MNEPCFDKPTGPDPQRCGLWLDNRRADCPPDPFEMVRHRTLTGICNDIRNPLMGSTGMPFARNVELDATFPDLGRTDLARNRHGARLDLLRPDPQVISRRLLSRATSSPDTCHGGRGLPGQSPTARCDYKTAPVLNVLAAFWVQFMTHDWFSHLTDGRNASEMMAMGCRTARVDGVERPLTRAQADGLGCWAADRIGAAAMTEIADPPTFEAHGRQRLARAFRTTRNMVTVWDPQTWGSFAEFQYWIRNGEPDLPPTAIAADVRVFRGR